MCSAHERTAAAHSRGKKVLTHSAAIKFADRFLFVLAVRPRNRKCERAHVYCVHQRNVDLQLQNVLRRTFPQATILNQVRVDGVSWWCSAAAAAAAAAVATAPPVARMHPM